MELKPQIHHYKIRSTLTANLDNRTIYIEFMIPAKRRYPMRKRLVFGGLYSDSDVTFEWLANFMVAKDESDARVGGYHMVIVRNITLFFSTKTPLSFYKHPRTTSFEEPMETIRIPRQDYSLDKIQHNRTVYVNHKRDELS